MATLLYRNSETPPEEKDAIRRHFPRHDHALVGIRNQLVIGRYYVLPFYRDVEEELRRQGSRLINSYGEHRYIANFDYYEDLAGLTPETWFRLEDVPRDAGPFVVKGRTNSRKQDWARMMYAPTFADAVRIAGDLVSNDALIGQQGIIVRRFEQLRVLDHGINGQPFANEWRFFFLGETRLAHGFYWTGSRVQGTMTDDGLAFAARVAKIVAERVSFFVVDIAEKADGSGWTLIELNDGQMSGLSEADPDVLYGALAQATAGMAP